MPDKLLFFMLGGPAIVREVAGPIITGILTVEYLSGMGDVSMPMTMRGPLGEGSLVLRAFSTEL